MPPTHAFHPAAVAHHAHLLHAAHAAAAAHAQQQQHQQQQQQLAMAQLRQAQADARASSPPASASASSTPSSTPVAHAGGNSSTPAKNERHSPLGGSSHTDSELEYDEDMLHEHDVEHDEEEDSIVDIEDMNADDSPRSTPDGLDSSSKSLEGSHGGPPGSGVGSSHMPSTILSPAALAASGHVPIRPTPFSALAAAAVAWGGMGGGVPWPGARQMPPFGPPGLFPGQGFGGGKCQLNYSKKLKKYINVYFFIYIYFFINKVKIG